MPREKYRVVEEHRASFSYAMIAKEEDSVMIGKEDTVMPRARMALV